MQPLYCMVGYGAIEKDGKASNPPPPHHANASKKNKQGLPYVTGNGNHGPMGALRSQSPTNTTITTKNKK